jgi:hypothetical protein
MRRDRAVSWRRAKDLEMTIRTRKFIGAVALLAFLAFYALVAMAVAIVLQVNDSKWIELSFYFIAGLLWVIPAGLLIRWMVRPDSELPARR